MSIEVTVTVSITSGGGRDAVTFKETRDPGSGNPKFHATTAEDALVDAGRTILDQMVKLYGDIRDDNPEPGSLTQKALARVLTEPRNGARVSTS